MRLIDADELKKRVVKVMFHDTPESVLRSWNWRH